MVRTPIVADYQKLNSINQSSTRNEIELMLGSPQGTGLHMVDGQVYDLSFYYGLSGKFTFSSAQFDSGTSFITYQSGELKGILYFTSKSTDPEISFSIELPIKPFLEKLVIGQSNINLAYEILGQPQYKGRRIDKDKGILHNLAFWGTSQPQNNASMKEKWILLGVDNQNIIQDIIWVSSYPEDIKAFGEVGEQQLKQVSRLIPGFLPYYDPQSISTSTKIDPVQVDALLKTNPTNIKAVKEVLGLPTAIGIKNLMNNSPMILSNWTFSKIDIKGHEDIFIPPGISEEEKERLEQQKSYMVMDVVQSLLLVGHDTNGDIKEIIWVKPVKQ